MAVEVNGGAVSLVEVGPAFAARYELGELLGQGGMGSIYRATEREGGRLVAAKFLRRDRLEADGCARFCEEARTLARVSHPNIVAILDTDVTDVPPYIIFEFIDGTTVSERIRSESPLPTEKVLDWAGQLCSAMQAAHDGGVLHRDLKSGNLMVDRDGVLKVTDFGLARRDDRVTPLTETGIIIGTPSYMAPEQIAASGKGVSTATDIYAAGVVLYEMFTGAVPFRRGGLNDVLLAHLHEPPPDPRQRRPELGSRLVATVLRCLEKRPEDRFGSFADLGRDLARSRRSLASAGQPTVAEAPDTERVHTVACDTERVHTVACDTERAPAVGGRFPWKVVLAFCLGAGVVALAWLISLGGPGPLPEGWLSRVVVETGTRSATLTWTTARARQFRFTLSAGERELHRGTAESVDGRRHRIHLASLAPDCTYEVLLDHGAGTGTIDVATKAPGLDVGVFACGLEDILYLDFRANVERDVSVRVEQETTCVLEVAPGGRGPIILPGLKRGARAYEWRVMCGEKALARGETAANPWPLANLTPPWGEREHYHPKSECPPLWFGERFLVIDGAGGLTCHELRRVSGHEGGQANVKVAWAVVPQGRRPLRKTDRRIGGLCRLPDGRVVVLTSDEKGVLYLSCFDGNHRAALWREFGNRPPALDAPAWTRPLVEGELFVKLDNPINCTPEGRGVYDHDRRLLFVQGRSMGDSPGFLCVDMGGERPRTLWTATVPIPQSRDAVYCQDTDEPGRAYLARAYDRAVEGRWSYSCCPVVVGGRLYSRLFFCNVEEIDDIYQCALLAVPATRAFVSGSQEYCFCFDSATRQGPVVASPNGDAVWVTGVRNVYRWAPAGDGQRLAMLPLLESKKTFLVSLAPGRDRSYGVCFHTTASSVRGYISEWKARLLAFEPGEPGGVEVTTYSNSLFSCGFHAIPDTRSLTVHGSSLVALFGHWAAVVDLASHRSGAWNFLPDRMRQSSSSQTGVVACPNSKGTIFVLPAALVVARGGVRHRVESKRTIDVEFPW